MINKRIKNKELTVKAFKMPLILSKKQRRIFKQHAIESRKLYNSVISQRQVEHWFRDSFPKTRDFYNLFIKGNKNFYTLSSTVLNAALTNADKAYQNFFNSCNGKRKGSKMGFPRYKSRKSPLKFENLYGPKLILDNEGFVTHLNLSKIGKVKLARKGYIPNDCDPRKYSCSERAGRWWISVVCEVKQPVIKPKSGVIGIDVGVSEQIVTSQGKHFHFTEKERQSIVKDENNLKKWQRKMAKRHKRGARQQSKGFYEAKLKVQQLEMRLQNIKDDRKHKSSRRIIDSNPSLIRMEDLNVKGMLKNSRRARSTSDAAMSKTLAFIAYKAKWAGTLIEKVNTSYPSSQICNDCGQKDRTSRRGKIYTCNSCGAKKDADFNASLNIRDAREYFDEKGVTRKCNTKSI